MKVRVGINGFGRIGRLVFRAMAARPESFDIVAINDLTDTRALAMLLKYDSVHGRFPGSVDYDDTHLFVNEQPIKIISERNPAQLPWKTLDVQVALESTGVFTGRATEDKPGYDSHLEAGADRVVLSATSRWFSESMMINFLLHIAVFPMQAARPTASRQWYRYSTNNLACPRD